MALGGKRWQFGFWDPDGFQASPGKHHIFPLNTVLTGSFDPRRLIAILKSCFCGSIGIPALKPHALKDGGQQPLPRDPSERKTFHKPPSACSSLSCCAGEYTNT